MATVIADWTGVPLSSLMKDEQTELLSLEESLGKRVVGQEAALSAIARRLRAAKTGLTPENGPQGVFLLVGPSGTGKTETALALADALFGGEKALITINLSEYQGAAHRQPAEGFSARLRRLRPGRDPDRGGAQTPLQRGAAR